MSILLSLLLNPTVLAIIAGFFAALGWGWKQRRAGAASERAKQAKAEQKARTIADEIDDAIAGREPDENRKELRTWSKS